MKCKFKSQETLTVTLPIAPESKDIGCTSVVTVAVAVSATVLTDPRCAPVFEQAADGLIDLLMIDGIISLLEAKRDWLSLPEASICLATVESCLSIEFFL